MNDDDLQALLRGADPATTLPPADRARLTDLVEDAMTTTRPTPADESWDAPGRTRAARRRRPWLVGMAVAVGVAAAAVVVTPVVLSLGPGPTTTELAAEPFDPAMAMCQPVADFLPALQVAFAGRVTAVDGERVTLDVERVYRGEPGDLVVVDAPLQDDSAVVLVGGFPFEVGGEYLVSARDGVVAACGASGPATPELQAEYDRAFG